MLRSDKSRSEFSGNNSRFFSRDYLQNVTHCKLKITQSVVVIYAIRTKRKTHHEEQDTLNECTLPSFTTRLTFNFLTIIDNSHFSPGNRINYKQLIFNFLLIFFKLSSDH